MSLMLGSLLSKDSLRRVAGLLWFDLVWFCTVAGRNDWLLVALPVVAVQIYLSSTRVGFNWWLYLQLLVLGLLFETVVVVSGILDFTGGFLPLWLVALWLGFAAMVTTTLDWLAGRYLLAALIGIGSGPMTYAIGSRLGAAELQVDEYVMWLIYGLLWGLYMVIFAYLMKRNKRPSEE